MSTKPTTIQISRAMLQLFELPAVPQEQYISVLRMFLTASAADLFHAVQVAEDEVESFCETSMEDLAEVYKEFGRALAKIETGDEAALEAGLQATRAKFEKLKLPEAATIFPSRPDKTKS
jgi:hypothetical protein